MTVSKEKPLDKMTRKELIELFSQERAEWQSKHQELEENVRVLQESINAEWQEKRQEIENEVGALQQNVSTEWQGKRQEIENEVGALHQSINTEWQGKRQEIENEAGALHQSINTEWQGKRQEIENEVGALQQNINTEWQGKRQEIENEVGALQQNINTEWQGKRQEIENEVGALHQSINTEWQSKRQEIENKAGALQQNISTEWQNRRQEIENEAASFHENLQAEWQKKYQDLEEKIESLLPGAASAGLASNFNKAKEKAGKTDQFLYGFIGSATLLLLLYAFLFWWSYESGWVSFLIKLPIGFPIIWVGWFCQRSISQAKKVEEMYNHKANIMALYQGFIRAIPDGSEDKLTPGTIREILVSPAEIIKDFKTPIEAILSREEEKKQKKEVRKVIENG